MDDRDLLRKLDRLKKGQVRAAIRKGTRPGAKVVQEALKAAMPAVSGVMRRKTAVRALKRSRKYVGHAVIINVFYAGFFVHGTKRQAANEAIKEVLESTKRPAIETTMAIIKVEIEKAR